MRRSHEVLRANPALSGASTPVAAGTQTRITLFAVLLALSLTAATVFAGRASAAFEPAACSELRVEAAGQVIEAGAMAALKTARCGYLTVPENRLRPTGRTISLAVAIVPSVSPTPAPDPVVYLAGGPGTSAISSAAAAVDAGFNRDRELILVDQRGVGFSKPLLFSHGERRPERPSHVTGYRCAVRDRSDSRVESGPSVVRFVTSSRSRGRSGRAC